MEIVSKGKKRKLEEVTTVPDLTQKRRKNDRPPAETKQSSKSDGSQLEVAANADTNAAPLIKSPANASTGASKESKRQRRKRKAAAQLNAASASLSLTSPPSQQLISEQKANAESKGSHKHKRDRENVSASVNVSEHEQPNGQAANVTSNALARQQGDDLRSNLTKAQRKALKKARRQARSPNVRPSQHPIQSENTSQDQADGTSNGLTKRQRKKLRLAEIRRSQAQDGSAQQTAADPKQEAVQRQKDVHGSNPHTVAHQSEKPLSRPSWTLSSPSGSRLIEHDPVFVSDARGGQFLVASNGGEMQLLSLEDSLQVHSWAAPSDVRIVAFSGSVLDPAVIHVALSDASTAQWNWISNTLNSRQHFGSNWHAHRKVIAMGAASTTSGNEATSEKVYRVDCKGDLFSVVAPPNVLFATDAELSNLIVLDHASLIIAYGPKTLVVGKRTGQEADTDADFDWLEIPLQGLPVTSAAAHVSTAMAKGSSQPAVSLALGNKEGQIHIYYDLGTIFNNKGHSGQSKLPSPRTLHWHRDAVSCLKFSTDGSYLISGGKETVLVIWQLETGKQQYLPHLASEIEKIVVSPAGDRYALQMGDNSIIVLSTSELKAVAAFGGLQMLVDGENDETVPQGNIAAALHPVRSNELILSVPSSQPKTAADIAARPFLETFDVQTSRHLSRQAVTRNNVTDFNLGPERSPIDPPDVKLLAISSNGDWLATVDEWIPPATDVDYLATFPEAVEEEQAKRKEVFLKIWRWESDKDGGVWALDFRADAPHTRAGTQEDEVKLGAGSVLALVADPHSTGFASVGEDGALKIWRPRQKSRGKADFIEWRLARHIQLPVATDRVSSLAEEAWVADPERPSKACLAWSEDGSMLAATLAYPDNDGAQLVYFINAFTGAISSKQGVVGPDVVALGFLSRHLVLLSWRDIRLWDVVADSLHFHYKLPTPANEHLEPSLAVDPREEGTFAVAIPRTAKGKPSLRVWTPKRTKPVANMELDVPIATMLAGKGRPGYVCIFKDATIRTLYPLGSALPAPAVNGSNAVPALPDIEPSTVEMDVDQPSLLSAASVTRPDGEKQQLAIQAGAEDDRPVVRPEQLASVFEGAHRGTAMPSMREIFNAVVGLFGRKPRKDIVEGT